MTVNTPFAGDRPGLPWLVPYRQTPLEGIGDAQTAAQILNAVTAGSLAAEQTYANQFCPIGTAFNPMVGYCQPSLSGAVSATGSSGMLILLAVGAALYLFSRK